MNELQRQQYLSALGVDSYMPRLHLPFAPASIACELPSVDVLENEFASAGHSDSFVATQAPILSGPTAEPGSSPVNLIGELLDPKRQTKSSPAITGAADILASLETKVRAAPIAIEPFSLSIWRPSDGLLVVDSRNSKLALPTEQFLKNIVRTIYGNRPLQMQEEVLRWPMIENSFAKRTLADARNELQTWLAVQCEIRPITHIWLMGQNAATYFLDEQDVFADCIFERRPLAEVKLDGLLLPSLNELLQQQRNKPKLFNALRQYYKPQI